MRSNMIVIDIAAYEWSENLRSAVAAEEIEAPVLQIADAGREPEPE